MSYVEVRLLGENGWEDFDAATSLEEVVDRTLSLWREDDSPVLFEFRAGARVLATMTRDASAPEVAVLVRDGCTQRFRCHYITHNGRTRTLVATYGNSRIID